MKTSISEKQFSSFTSYSLVINDHITNFWDTDKRVIEQFKTVFDNSNELQQIALSSLSEHSSFDICSFINPDLLLSLLIQIINIDNVTEYWDMEKLIGYDNIEQIFSVQCPYQVNKSEFTESFVKAQISEKSFTQLNRLYKKTGQRAVKLVCFVFNYGYHFSTIFN